MAKAKPKMDAKGAGKAGSKGRGASSAGKKAVPPKPKAVPTSSKSKTTVAKAAKPAQRPARTAKAPKARTAKAPKAPTPISSARPAKQAPQATVSTKASAKPVAAAVAAAAKQEKPEKLPRTAPKQSAPLPAPRAKDPVLPLSAKALRAKVRTPEGAEDIKARIGALTAAIGKIRTLKRTLPKTFYEIGEILQDIEINRLYEVKGYGSFEAFVEREIDLGKQLSLRIRRVVQTFLRDAALAAGFDRVSAALMALEGDSESASAPASSNSGSTATAPQPPSRGPRIPVHKQ